VSSSQERRERRRSCSEGSIPVIQRRRARRQSIYALRRSWAVLVFCTARLDGRELEAAMPHDYMSVEASRPVMVPVVPVMLASTCEVGERGRPTAPLRARDATSEQPEAQERVCISILRKLMPYHARLQPPSLLQPPASSPRRRARRARRGSVRLCRSHVSRSRGATGRCGRCGRRTLPTATSIQNKCCRRRRGV
jgi:hypothetical protein